MSHDVSWIHTFSGKKVYPLNAKPEDISIVDIAHALSLQCRFTGHTRYFYSVAQHSLLVSLLLHDQAKPDHVCLWGLLHDASEAYLIDVARPIKHLPEFHAYRECEKDLMAIICERFGMPKEQPEAVHEADMMALSIEAHQLMGDVSEWDLVKPDTRYRIMPQAPIDVEYEFRSVFGGLTL